MFITLCSGLSKEDARTRQSRWSPLLTSAFVAKVRKQLPETALRDLYRNDVRIGAVLRAALQPAMTTTPTWAAELAQSSVGPMLLGAPVPSAFAALSERSLQR